MRKPPLHSTAVAVRDTISPSAEVEDLGQSRVIDASDSLALLRNSVTSWIEPGRSSLLSRWLERELDPDGVPRRMPVSEWAEGLRLLAEAVGRRKDGWPERFDTRAEGWFRVLLRFSRPDATTVFSAGPRDRAWEALFRLWAERLSDPGFSTVVDWWFPQTTRRRHRHAAPPLPADSRPDRPLAVLRANWTRDGDFLAIDHRTMGASTLLEIFGQGVCWLGPGWTSGTQVAPASRSRPALWLSQSAADCFEWSFRIGQARVTRTAVLLRGRRLALLAEQWDGPDDPGMIRFDLANGVTASPVRGSRALALASARGRRSARVYPIGLPRLPYATERGSFSVEGRTLVLNQAAAGDGRRTWRGIVVSWDSGRNRRPTHWRTLTVSEDSRVCTPATAFAARLSWGRDDSLLIYRSLASPALRAALGHQTRARFLIGVFSREGDVEPLVAIDEQA
jgi:hypothetical protein